MKYIIGNSHVAHIQHGPDEMCFTWCGRCICPAAIADRIDENHRECKSCRKNYDLFEAVVRGARALAEVTRPHETPTAPPL